VKQSSEIFNRAREELQNQFNNLCEKYFSGILRLVLKLSKLVLLYAGKFCFGCRRSKCFFTIIHDLRI